MFQKQQMIIVMSVLGLVLASLIGCQWWDRDDRTPTTPARGDSFALTNYAQMDGGSQVIDAQQLNWVISNWGAFPYHTWMYMEINQQDTIGMPPGEHQIPVTLNNVVLSFTELPDVVSHIVIGLKAINDPDDQTFTERDWFVVEHGSVNIPLDYADLVYYFGITHYSIWFQAIGGGKNGQEVNCGQLAVSGAMPSGQMVTFRKRICFGTHPTTTPTPTFSSPPVLPNHIVLWSRGISKGRIGGGTGRSSMDAWCVSDPNKPTGYSNYKVFIASTEDNKGLLDLGIPTNVEVRSKNGTVVVSSLSTACSGVSGDILTENLKDAGVIPAAPAGSSGWWSGASTTCNVVPNRSCDAWSKDTSSPVTYIGIAGYGFVKTNGWVFWANTLCDADRDVLCVAW